MDFLHPVQAVIPGVQGQVLAVLAETTAELNLSTLARLAGVSVAQASRVMPKLVQLGLVERRELPPSSQFRLVRENVAAQAIIDLARSRDNALKRLGESTAAVPFEPVSIIAFGSFARGEADEQSDLDVVVVRPEDIDEDDDDWASAVQRWSDEARAITGNRVEVLEVSHDEVRTRLASQSPLWSDILKVGITVHGLPINCLKSVHA